ncbi:MAG: cation:dicarboxylase symporter family transporter [Cyclobacteriaceae bacterium]|nr:cation:dicarboxylase symporter family transporter [Cyclobacteriaceae bacterium]
MKEKLKWFIPLGSLMGLGLGIVVGLLTHATSSFVLRGLIPYAELAAKIWIVLLLVIALPLVVIHLFGSIMRLASTRLGGKLVFYGLLVHVILLTTCTLLSIIISYAITSDLNLKLLGFVASPFQTDDRSAVQHLINYLGIMQRTVAQLIVPVMVFVVLFSIGVFKVQRVKQRLVVLAKTWSQKIFSVVNLVFYMLPFAVACLTFVMVSKNGMSLGGIAGFYVLGVCGILVVAILFLFGVAHIAGGTSVLSFLRAIFPAQLVAFSTCSSLACLPALLVSARKLGVSSTTAGITIPFFVSFFRINLMVANPFSFFLLSSLYGLPVDATNLLSFIALMMVTSFASPGLPQMGNVYSLPVFLAAGIPLEGVLVLKALDAIPDVFKTILNVTEVGVVSSIIMRWDKEGSLSQQTNLSRVHSETSL